MLLLRLSCVIFIKWRHCFCYQGDFIMTNNLSKIVIITARGGSKRIQRKNIKDFCGKPIIVYSIEAALNSKLFDEVMVSTDDAEIVEVAKKYGANVPFMRSAKNSDDYATTADVLNEVLEEYSKRGKTFEYMCCIYPTAPFVTAEKLQLAFKLLQEQNADAVIPVVKFSYPPQRSFVLENGFLKYKWSQYIRSRSQDLEAFYHDAGQFYFYLTNSFIRKEEIKAIPIFMDSIEVQDIGNLSDWKLAEIKYRILNERNGVRILRFPE